MLAEADRVRDAVALRLPNADRLGITVGFGLVILGPCTDGDGLTSEVVLETTLGPKFLETGTAPFDDNAESGS